MLNSWLPITRIKIFGARILYRLTTLFVGKKRRRVNRGGILFELDLAEGIELSMFLFGRFQQHIFSNKHLALPPDAVILDIGANVGLMTLQFAAMVPEGEVFAFEPTHYALARLRQNIELNPALAGRIRVINTFVSERSDSNPSIVAYSSWRVDGGKDENVHPVHLGTPKGTEGVGSVSLDDFVARQNIQRIDFIKVDTDGHEYEVFRGAAATIARFRPRVIFEIGLYVMEEKNITYGFYDDYFKKLGYTLIDTKTGKVVTPGNHRRYIPLKGSTDLIAIPS